MEGGATTNSSIPGCSADQQFRLCWKNHSDNLRESFSHNQLRENYVDVTIACGTVFIKAHKLILSASSSFFRKLFKVHDAPHPVVVLDNVNPEHMQFAIEFMYRGEIDVKNSDLADILSIGEKFGIKGLSSVKLNNQQDSASKSASAAKTTTEKDPLALDKDSNGDKNEKNDNEKPTSSGGGQEGAGSNSQAATSSSDNDNDDLCATICTTVETPPEFQPYNLDSSPKLSHSSGSIFMDPKTMEPVKVPRPPNAFMLFARQWRKKLATENPTEQNKVISKRLGLKWQQLSPYEKQKYFVAAEKAQKEHMKKYPGYVYNPKEARLRKDMREKRMHPVQLVQFVMSEPMRQPVTMVNRPRAAPTYSDMETENYEDILDDEIELVEEKVVPTSDKV